MIVHELKRWRDFLSGEIAKLEQSGAVHPLCSDPELFVFQCVTDALLARAEIEAAAEQFIASGAWPQLDDEHTI